MCLNYSSNVCICDVCRLVAKLEQVFFSISVLEGTQFIYNIFRSKSSQQVKS